PIADVFARHTLQIRVMMDACRKFRSVKVRTDRVPKTCVQTAHKNDLVISSATVYGCHSIASRYERQTLRLIEMPRSNMEIAVCIQLSAFKSIETVVVPRDGCRDVRGP